MQYPTDLKEIRLLNHELNYSFSNEVFANVTLFCDYQKTIKAHKSVLSAASTFFKEIFLDNMDPDCVLILPSYYFDLTSAIVNLIYKGETHVRASNLDTFEIFANRF